MRWYDRLRRSGEIAFVRRAGRRATFSTFSAYGVGSGSGPWRVGISVSKAVGNAVIRNRVKRRVRGALDALAPPGGRCRVLFVMKAAAAAEPYPILAGELALAVERLALAG